jgi:hypothetical protein
MRNGKDAVGFLGVVHSQLSCEERKRRPGANAETANRRTI